MTMACNRAPQRGFVLAITLWLLAGIAIAVALMMLWARDQLLRAQEMRERVEDQIAMQETRDVFLYLGATREVTLAGLSLDPIPDDLRAIRRLSDFGVGVYEPMGSELRLDDSAYQGVRGTTFSIQDEAGLFPMVLPGAVPLDNFLRSQGVEEGVIPALRDALLDYIDEDDLKRLNGAESAEYVRQHIDGPAGRRLLTPPELRKVLGWNRLPPEKLARIQNSITPYYSGPTNLNTAPESLLPAWLDGCPEVCAHMVERRTRLPFRNSSEVQGVLVARLSGDGFIDYRYVAGDTFRLTLSGRAGPVQRFHVVFTPLADNKAPWSVLASYSANQLKNNDIAQKTGSILFADKDSPRN